MRWHAVNLNEFAGDWRVRDERDEDVLTLRYGHRDDHAHLAAAAPQMLAVLKTMAALCAGNSQVPWEVMSEAWRAIAKAEGDKEIPF